MVVFFSVYPIAGHVLVKLDQLAGFGIVESRSDWLSPLTQVSSLAADMSLECQL